MHVRGPASTALAAGIGLQTVCPALQAALAELGVPCQQLQRIDDKLVRELLALQAKETAVASKVTGTHA